MSASPCRELRCSFSVTILIQTTLNYPPSARTNIDVCLTDSFFSFFGIHSRAAVRANLIKDRSIKPILLISIFPASRALIANSVFWILPPSMRHRCDIGGGDCLNSFFHVERDKVILDNLTRSYNRRLALDILSHCQPSSIVICSPPSCLSFFRFRAAACSSGGIVGGAM